MGKERANDYRWDRPKRERCRENPAESTLLFPRGVGSAVGSSLAGETNWSTCCSNPVLSLESSVVHLRSSAGVEPFLLAKYSQTRGEDLGLRSGSGKRDLTPLGPLQVSELFAQFPPLPCHHC